MRSPQHQEHIRRHVSHSNCHECTADNSRSFCRTGWPTPPYQHISTYLAWVKAGFAGLRVKVGWCTEYQGDSFRREFTKALDTRIFLKSNPPTGRKWSDGYLERLGGLPRTFHQVWRGGERETIPADYGYLRHFAERRGYGN